MSTKSSFSRRKFVRLAAGSGMLISLGALSSCGSDSESKDESTRSVMKTNPYIDNPGVQLYTVRDVLTDDMQGTLAAIAEMGFKQIELHSAGLLPVLGPMIKSMGMTVTASHFTTAHLTGNWEIYEAFGVSKPEYGLEEILSNCAKFGVKYLVFPMLFPQERGDLDMYKKFAADFNGWAETAAQAGVMLAYHNHNFEFEPMGESSPYDVFRQEMDPEKTCFELDVFWAKMAGLDPAQLIRDLKGRVKLLHLKDLKAGMPLSYNTMETAANHPDAFKEVGEGSVDFKEVLKAAEEVGVEYCYVEQDHTPANPLDSLKKSIANLKAMA